MKIKKVLGYLYITISFLLTLALLGQIGTFVGSIIGFLKIFSGSLDAAAAGDATGHFIYWFLHIGLIIVLWVNGQKRISNNNISSSQDLNTNK